MCKRSVLADRAVTAYAIISNLVAGDKGIYLSIPLVHTQGVDTLHAIAQPGGVTYQAQQKVGEVKIQPKFLDAGVVTSLAVRLGFVTTAV